MSTKNDYGSADMKYVNQLEYPDMIYITNTKKEGEAFEKGKTTTIKGSGCCICSAVMVADRLLPNCNFDLEQSIQLSYDSDSNCGPGTASVTFIPAFAEKLGFTYERTNNIERLKYCLATGGAAIVNVGGDHDGHIGLFSHGGHYIAAIGVEPDGRIAILDPSYKENKYEEEGRAGKVEMKNGVIALCTPEVLADDCTNRSTPYNLFWRK